MFIKNIDSVALGKFLHHSLGMQVGHVHCDAALYALGCDGMLAAFAINE